MFGVPVTPTGRVEHGGKARDRAVASAADPVWADVRVALMRELERRGPMWVHAIHVALPDGLKRRAERAGLPLTPAWLRLQLVRMADAGDGVAEVEGRFALAEAPRPEPVPEPGAAEVEAVPPPLSSRRFWVLFVAEVHDLLLERGPMTAGEILAGLPESWVEGTKRYEEIDAVRLRQKLRERIKSGRPLEELPGKRFAATASWPGSRTLDPDEDA